MGLSAAAKFWVAFAFAVIIAALTAAQTAMSDGVFSAEEIITVVLAFFSAALVWLVPNKTGDEDATPDGGV